MSRASRTDVAIIGGGLAGLTLARQLRQAEPDLDITVLERNRFPYPRAAHKVGESTVEIGAHYLDERLQLGNVLSEEHLPKHGLRLFFGEFGDDLSRADELGTSKLLAVPTFQLDRGHLENQLRDLALQGGITVRDGVSVRDVETDAKGHRLRCRNGNAQDQDVDARWVIDAASRASPLKRRLGLHRDNDHDVNAAWFRVRGRVQIERWTGCESWQQRCGPTQRWLSTNHLMGPGYWVWVIPLAGDVTSIGIVADPSVHPLESIQSLERAQAWLAVHQPRCAAALADLEVLDFRFLRHYSHDCAQIFSDQRWALSGESGAFLDPFYSPGSDFIAIANEFLTDLIARDRRGERLGARSQVYERMYQSFLDSTYQLYFRLYPGFGDRELMVLKTVWDYAYYWGVLAALYFSRTMTDVGAMSHLGPALLEVQAINVRIQDAFRRRANARRRFAPEGRFVDQCAVPILARYNTELVALAEGGDAVASIKAHVKELGVLAEELSGMLLHPERCRGSSPRLGDLHERLHG